jgi:hypothetical protein
MTRYAIRLICFILLIFQFSLLNFAQNNPQTINRQKTIRLESEKPVQGELKSGEVHVYTFPLTPAQSCIINIIEYGIDLRVDIYSPSGRPIRTIDYPKEAPIPLSVRLWKMPEMGDYRFEVRLQKEQTNPGRYQVKVKIEEENTFQNQNIQEAKIKSFALSLAEAKSEEERTALLSKGKELITFRLIYELYQHIKRFQNERNNLQVISISQLSIKLAEQLESKKEKSEVYHQLANFFMRRREFTIALEYMLKSVALGELFLQTELPATPLGSSRMLSYTYGQLELPRSSNSYINQKKIIANQLV